MSEEVPQNPDQEETKPKEKKPRSKLQMEALEKCRQKAYESRKKKQKKKN